MTEPGGWRCKDGVHHITIDGNRADVVVCPQCKVYHVYFNGEVCHDDDHWFLNEAQAAAIKELDKRRLQ